MNEEVEILQRVIGQYAEENANMRIAIERLVADNKILKEQIDAEKGGDKK